MITIDFSNLSPLVDDVLLEMPGLISTSVKDMAIKVVADFCERTQCFREEIIFHAGADHYDLFSPHEDAVVIGLVRVETESGKQMIPGDYRQDTIDRVELTEKLDEKATAVVALKPMESSTRIPTFMLHRWRGAIATGIKARFMVQPNFEWSNPNLGARYQNEYEIARDRARADVRDDFSVTRRGRKSTLQRLKTYC